MKYRKAEKQVKQPTDIDVWHKSEAYAEYIGFIQTIGEAIKGVKIRDSSLEHSEAVSRLLQLISRLDSWIDEILPIEQPQRFGNKAFRDWHERLKTNSKEILTDLLSNDGLVSEGAIDELTGYLEDSFGNSTRIDYGTGHEMAFVMFLAILFRIGALNVEKDKASVGLTVFDKYLKLARRLQTTYKMEPAGSQGVWALDDYQFVPFIWGAAQCRDPTKIRVKPKSIPDYEMAETLAPDFHFFAAIKYISEVKTGPFHEHSNKLYNVSGVPNWEKVFTGLIKMYRAEVLSKFPVIQHTLFGSVFTLDPAEQPLPPLTETGAPIGSALPRGAGTTMPMMPPGVPTATMIPRGSMMPPGVPVATAMPRGAFMPPAGPIGTTMPPRGPSMSQ